MAVGELVVSLLAETGSFETDTKRAADQLVKLEKVVKQLQKTMSEGYQASDNFVGPLQPSKMRPAIDSVDNLTRAVQKSQAGFRASNQIMQQASYQVTDFVVQVSGGVSAMRAFSQQAPQLLAAFGGGGALLGVFAALGGAIADIVMKTANIKDTAKIFEDLDNTASALNGTLSMTGKVDLSSLGKNYREATVEGKKLIDANITLGMLMLDLAKIDATENFRKGIQQSLDDIGFFSRAWNLVVNSAKYSRVTDVQGFQQGPGAAQQFADIMGITEEQANAINDVQIAFANGTKSASDYINVLAGIGNEYKTKLNPEFKTFIKTQGEYATSLEQQRTLEKSLTEARDNNYKGLEKATKAQENFIQALKERTKRTEEGEIAMLRMQAAEKGVAAQAAPLIELLKEANWAKGATKFAQTLELSTQQMQFQQSLIGQSAMDVELLNSQYKIQVDLQKQIQELTRSNGEVSQEQVERMKAAADANLAIQQAMITSKYGFSGGMTAAFDSYAKSAGNAAANIQNAFSNAFRNMEEGLVQFAMTGKMNFSSFANSVISDIMRIYIRMAITGLISRFATAAIAPAASSNTFTYDANGEMVPSNYAEGGYTGDGGKYQPAGIVHAGEFVMTKEATSRIGVGNLYRMMRGYADGGYVGGSMPSYSGGNVNINIKNEAGGDGYQASATARKNENGIDVEIMVRKALTTDLRNNGPMAQTMSSTFGLRRSA